MTGSRLVRVFSAMVCAALGFALFPATGAAQQKYTFGIPGIPPVFGGTIALVAEKEGFFKKRGVDVTVRAFETGAAASRAVASGEIAVSLSPTPLIVNQISNTNVKLVGIWGMEHPDWLIGATDPNAECASMKGQAVGVDSLGGARSIALRTMLVGCKMKIEEVQQVPLSSNVGTAMVAGQLKFGVLHIDDIPVIEAEMKKPLKTIVTQKAIRPVDHYLLMVAHQDHVAKNRDAYVRMVAALIDAERFMRNPANHEKVAKYAEPTGRTGKIAVQALKAYVEMEFWPKDKDGLGAKNIEMVGNIQKKVGNLKAEKPAPYDRIVDTSIWRDAKAMVDGK
ncbi:MAG: ABC-type nitrate/sulfonate/bicarbonate transport system periplasmic component-like protein [Burkholderiales bacterium]|nr:ABC-type nitrate/sulfonate/bicarbonate transport system periplasmic component-like protein [Burkholderiales bacterium]